MLLQEQSIRGGILADGPGIGRMTQILAVICLDLLEKPLGLQI